MTIHSNIPLNNDNEILATKRAWKKGDINRRKKDGSVEDRKMSADILTAGRIRERNIREIERSTEHNAWVVAVCILLAVFVIVFWPHTNGGIIWK